MNKNLKKLTKLGEPETSLQDGKSLMHGLEGKQHIGTALSNI
jgi:hypothetical protein